MKSRMSASVVWVLIFSCVFSALAHAQDNLWLRTLTGPAGSTTSARHSGLLNSGDVIVGGQFGTGATSTRNFQVVRIRGTDGAVMWTREIDAGSGDDINDLVVDPATGETYFCGRTTVTGQQLNWYVMKLNGADGTNAWTSAYTYNNSNINDECRALSLVQDGAVKNVVVVGQFGTASNFPARIVKLSQSNGAELWAINAPPTSGSIADFFSVVTDASGNIYALGNQNSDTATVTKFSVAGTQLWRQSYQGPNTATSAFNSWSAGEVEPTSGDLLVSGSAAGGTATGNNDIAVARYRASDGVRLWTRLINGFDQRQLHLHQCGIGELRR